LSHLLEPKRKYSLGELEAKDDELEIGKRKEN
jgi:hypothetical protein